MLLSDVDFALKSSNSRRNCCSSTHADSLCSLSPVVIRRSRSFSCGTPPAFIIAERRKKAAGDEFLQDTIATRLFFPNIEQQKYEYGMNIKRGEKNQGQLNTSDKKTTVHKTWQLLIRITDKYDGLRRSLKFPIGGKTWLSTIRLWLKYLLITR